MIAYVMVGTNNLESAVKFYDQLMPKMNMTRVELSNDFALLFIKRPENIEFYITKPFDGNQANSGNGTMIAFSVENIEIVANCHRAGIDAGGKDEALQVTDLRMEIYTMPMFEISTETNSVSYMTRYS